MKMMNPINLNPTAVMNKMQKLKTKFSLILYILNTIGVNSPHLSLNKIIANDSNCNRKIFGNVINLIKFGI